MTEDLEITKTEGEKEITATDLTLTYNIRKKKSAVKVSKSRVYDSFSHPKVPKDLDLLSNGQMVRKYKKQRPNAPCTCGSGKKVKKCCWRPYS